MIRHTMLTTMLSLAWLTAPAVAFATQATAAQAADDLRKAATALQALRPQVTAPVVQIDERAIAELARAAEAQVRDAVAELCDRFPIYAGALRRLYEQERGAYDLPPKE